MVLTESGKRWVMALALCVGVWGWSPLLGGSEARRNTSLEHFHPAGLTKPFVSEPSPWTHLDLLLQRPVNSHSLPKEAL